MQESDKLTREEIIAEFKDDAVILLKYLPWLENYKGQKVASSYTGEGIEEHSMAFPVYDGTLMGFIKTARKTKFINKNFVYTFSKYGLKTPEDERKRIEKCTLWDMRVLGDILSKYVLKGMTKSSVWSEGMEEGIFLAVLRKMKELLEIRP